MTGRYWLETLGCPKNKVDSDKLAGLLQSEGLSPARDPGKADLVVVNTCAFIEQARQESIDTVLELAGARKEGAKLVVTGCLAERYGQELADAMPEVDQVAGFGTPFLPVPWGASAPVRLLRAPVVPSFDLLNLPRPPARAPWAYLKVAEGCDRRCGFCAIPSFRGPQRSRRREDILAEVESLGDVQEVVLVAQDLVSWGRDAAAGSPRGRLVELMGEVEERVERVRLLYLYPSGLSDELIDAIGESGCPYFDLSLQHVSRALLRRMRRFGDGERFLERVAEIRRRFPGAALRSSFIVGYPGEEEEDHDMLLAFLQEASLDWAGFFAFSNEEGTHAAGLEGHVPSSLVAERLRECTELQDSITATRRNALVGARFRVLVDAPGEARSHLEAPEIDGAVRVPAKLPAGTWHEVEITGAIGPDLVARPVLGAS
ncbi:MAG TPA: 30S ribosomal protein S12 methylthiotransferase RimO [Acidimicrobiales bacterium]|nr:30S ribosomal protein S12 methylthiotransferase RimO [Acidimicrobiales bacterium]